MHAMPQGVTEGTGAARAVQKHCSQHGPDAVVPGHVLPRVSKAAARSMRHRCRREREALLGASGGEMGSQITASGAQAN
jgi:hypothetical protein